MAKRPKPNVDVAISELKTAIENDVNKFLEKAEKYAQKGGSEKCLADILADFNTAVNDVTTVLKNKTPRGDEKENTKKVSAASAALDKTVNVEEKDEYVEKLKEKEKESLKNPKNLKKGVYCPLHIISGSLTGLNASFTGISVSGCGVWASFTGAEVAWAFVGTSITGFCEQRRKINQKTLGLEMAAGAIESKLVSLSQGIEMGTVSATTVETKLQAVHNAVEALRTHV